jgi:adenine/guanine phosphoribosyltransferase-like PRPP-binding protein
MSENNGGWEPGFPPVMCFIDLENAGAKSWKLLANHPDYDAAKNQEDRAAALRLVHGFLKAPENQAQLNSLKQKYPGAVIVPIRAIEAGGKNRIPEILAEYIARKTEFIVDTNIVQCNRVHRTGSDEWHRFAFRPAFDGEAKAGRNYILVDDVFSLGGSFNELRRFIQSQGARVVQAIAMATGKSGPEITKTSRNRKHGPSDAPRPLTKQEIESLRQDAKEGHEWAQKALKNLKPLE